jgi:hypothetical protein
MASSGEPALKSKSRRATTASARSLAGLAPPPGGHVPGAARPHTPLARAPCPNCKGVRARLRRASSEPQPRRGRRTRIGLDFGGTGSAPQRARPRGRSRTGWGQGARRISQSSGVAPGLALECGRRIRSQIRRLHLAPWNTSASAEKSGRRHGFESPKGLDPFNCRGSVLRREAQCHECPRPDDPGSLDLGSLFSSVEPLASRPIVTSTGRRP